MFSCAFKKHRVEIILWKHEDGQMWRHLIDKNDRGEEIIDPELVKEIHKRMAHLCSEHEVSRGFH